MIWRFRDLTVAWTPDARAGRCGDCARVDVPKQSAESPNRQIAKFSVAAAVLALSGLAAVAQTPPPPPAEQPRFRSGVQVVEVDVRVFDGDGRFVSDLAREDFELLEEGVAQPIQTVFLVSSPVPGTPAEAAAGTGEAPRVPAAPPASARQTWIFVFDLNHLMPGGGFNRARQAVEDFLRDRFTDGDLAGIVAGTTMVNNRLTSVREELLAAVRSVKPLSERRRVLVEMTRDWPRLLNELEVMQIAREEREAVQRATIRACSEDPGQCPQADGEVRMKARRLAGEIGRNTMETLKAINALASGLARVPGPKTIVFLSDGFAVENVETALRGVVGQASRAGARVYAIDVRGLNRRGTADILDQAQVSDEAGAFTSLDALEDGPNSLAVDTGGLMIRNENNIGRALDTIAADANRFYLLAYQPANTNFDGTYRSIEVRVKRPGVRVRARKGYLALQPARMLLPQPIAPTPSPGGADDRSAAAGERADSTSGAASAGTEAPAPTTGGTVVSSPTAAPSGAMRLRPDAKGRVETLSGGNTSDAGALAQRGWEAYQRGDVESAIGPLTEAAASADARPWVLYALGLSQVALGRHAAAVVSWERVRQAAPDFEPVYIDLADSYVQLSNTTSALAVLREGEKRFPASADVQNAIGVIHVKRGALDEAIEAFEQAVSSDPDEPLGYLNLARTYELRYARGRRWVQSQRRWVAPEDDRRRAIEAYQRCVKLGGPYSAQAQEALNRLEWSRP